MRVIDTYKKIRDEVTLTNFELFALEELEQQLPTPKRQSLSANPFLRRCASNSTPPSTLALGTNCRSVVEEHVDRCRRDFMAMVAERVVDPREYVLGRRFYSDSVIFSLVREAAGVEEFFANQYGWVMDALRAAAQLDRRELFSEPA